MYSRGSANMRYQSLDEGEMKTNAGREKKKWRESTRWKMEKMRGMSMALARRGWHRASNQIEERDEIR
jgi:hypothetical protein